MTITHSAANAVATLTTTSLLPHRQLGAIRQDHVGCLLRPARIRSVFGGSRRFNSHPVSDFYRVSLPTATHESVWGSHLDLEILDCSTFVFRVDEDEGVGIDPVKFGHNSTDGDGLFRVVLGI